MDTTKIGLVLSGGGYKGLAHAGAIEFLVEQNIKPTVLAGTSAGSIVACLYALGMEPKDIHAFFKSVNIFSWEFITLTKPGFINVNAFDKYLRKIFNDLTLADLPIPVSINATNISTGELHLFSPNTYVVDAILASSAFPGVFSPYQIGDTLYNDGGILNNFPTDVLKYHCDYLIGSNVCPIQQLDAHGLKSVKSVAIRAYELMSSMHNHTRGHLCDWLIEPQDLTSYSTFERSKKRMDEIYTLGYESAKESFEAHKDKFTKAIL